MAILRVGTCSWKYPSWEGLVYSAESPADYLAQYARKYRTVEIDQWFWTRLPSPADVAAYRDAVDDGFLFTVKAPSALTLTHLRPAKPEQGERANPDFLSVELLASFLQRLEPLRSRLGVLMFQFGYLNRSMIAGQGPFLEKLDGFLRAAPSGVPYGVEIRNPRWLNREHFRFLRDHGMRHVFVQGYWLPQITDTYASFGDLLADSTVVRLHGPDRQGMEERSGLAWNRIIEPRDGELAAIGRMVRDLLFRGIDVFLNVNNHYEGSAPLTIERLRALGIVERGADR